MTTLSVTMQDPLISASLTDTVMHCLQNYITDYRTNKARHDLALPKTYEKQRPVMSLPRRNTQDSDANQNIILLSYRAEQERFRMNEQLIKYIHKCLNNYRWQELRCGDYTG